MKTTLVLALTLTAGRAFAQSPAPPSSTTQVDARFAPWIGCWRLDDDLAGTGARMCITPETGGVRMQTVSGSQRGIDEIVVPDAIAHPITDSECKGTEQAEWSKDDARLFRTTTVTCGKEATRTIKSVAFLAPGPSWVNVQHVSGAAANTAVRVQRYRRAANQLLADGSKAPQPDASLTLRTSPETTRWSVEDVIEASAKTPAEVVQAALTELHHGFDLNKRTLIALDQGNVDDQVIDLMVALTYPKRFIIERRGGGSAPAGILTGGGMFDPMSTPMMMGSYADCYSPYGYGYRSYYNMCNSMGYSPYGYDYYGYNNRYYGNDYYNGWVPVGAVLPQPGNTTVDSGDGRAINGRGYTQVRNRDAEPSAPRVNSGGNGTASGWSGNNGGGNATSGGYSSGSSSSGSSGGSSSGSDGGRVAVPKGGGH